MNRHRRAAMIAALLAAALGLACGEEEKAVIPLVTDVEAPCSGEYVRATGSGLAPPPVLTIDGVAVPIATATDTELTAYPRPLSAGDHEVRLEFAPRGAVVIPVVVDTIVVAVGEVTIDRFSPPDAPQDCSAHLEIHGANFTGDVTVAARSPSGTTTDLFATFSVTGDTLISGITAKFSLGIHEITVKNNHTSCPSEDSKDLRFDDIPCAGTLDGGALSRLEVPAGPHPVAIGDVSGDGINDVVVAGRDPAAVTVFVNDGTGTFTPYAASLIAGDEPTALAIGAINSDVRNDVVVAAGGNNVVRVLFQSSSGAILPAADASTVTVSTPAEPTDLALTDGNGDGFLDIVVATPTARQLTVYYGNTDGTFGGALALVLDATGLPEPMVVTAADFWDNASGAHELITVTSSSQLWRVVFDSDGSRTWVPELLTTTGTIPSDVAIADAGTVVDTAAVFGEGLDALISGTSSEQLAVFFGIEQGATSRLDRYRIDPPAVFTPLDMQLVPETEIIVTYRSGLVEQRVFVRAGELPSLVSTLDLAAEPYAIAKGRLDGDDRDDFVVGMVGGETAYVFLTD